MGYVKKSNRKDDISKEHIVAELMLDVYRDNGQICAYVRLRWGNLYAEYPSIDGEVIYNTHFSSLLSLWYIILVKKIFITLNLINLM